MSVAEIHIVKSKRTRKHGALSFDFKLYIDGIEQKTAVEVNYCFSSGWLTVCYADGTVKNIYVGKALVFGKRKKPLFKKIRKNKKAMCEVMRHS